MLTLQAAVNMTVGASKDKVQREVEVIVPTKTNSDIHIQTFVRILSEIVDVTPVKYAILLFLSPMLKLQELSRKWSSSDSPIPLPCQPT